MALPVITKKNIQDAASKSGLPGSAEGPQDAYRHVLAGVIIGHYLGAAGQAIVGFLNYTEKHYSGPPLASRLNDIHNNNLGYEIGLQDGSFEEKLEIVAGLFGAPGGTDRQPGRPAYTKTHYGSEFEVRTHLVLDSLGVTENNARPAPSADTPAPTSGEVHGPPPPPDTGGQHPGKPPTITRPLGKVPDEDTVLIDIPEKALLFLMRLLMTELSPPPVDDVPIKPIDPPTMAEIVRELRKDAAKITLRDFMNALIILNAGDNKRLEKALRDFMRSLSVPAVNGTFLDSITDWTVSDPPREGLVRKPSSRKL